MFHLRRLLLLILFVLASSASAEEIRTKHGDITLNANLEKGNSDWTSGNVVLMTHGTLAHRGMEIMATLQELLAEREISSLAINLSLGLNDRPATMYDCPTSHTHKHTDAVGEIGAWVDWLKQQGVGKITLLGHSRGGNQTARFAVTTTDPVISQVVLIAPQTWDKEQAAAGYQKRYGQPLDSLLGQAEEQVAAGKEKELMSPPGFIYCADTKATAEAFVSYYRPDVKMDTPRLIPEIKAPVMIFAGSEDKSVAGLIEKTQPLADGTHVRLEVIEGAGHFFRDLYAEDIADQIAETIGN